MNFFDVSGQVCPQKIFANRATTFIFGIKVTASVVDVASVVFGEVGKIIFLFGIAGNICTGDSVDIFHVSQNIGPVEEWATADWAQVVRVRRF